MAATDAAAARKRVVIDRPDLLDQHGPIFLIGAIESGLGQLNHILSAHPQIEPMGGWAAPPRLMHAIARSKSAAERRMLLNIKRDIFWRYFYKKVEYRADRLLEVYLGNQSLRHVLQRQERQGRALLFYEPFAAFCAKELADYYPQARFIHAVRDGLEVADIIPRRHLDLLDQAVLDDPLLRESRVSAIGFTETAEDGRHVPWWIEPAERPAFLASGTFERCLYFWRTVVGRARALAEIAGPERYIEIRHDDLVRDLEGVTRNLLGWLDLSWSPRLQRRIRKVPAPETGMQEARRPEELAAAQRICGKLLRELNGDLGATALPLAGGPAGGSP